MRVGAALHVRDTGLRHRVRAADLDAVHQVEPPRRHFLDEPRLIAEALLTLVDTANYSTRPGLP